MINMNQSDVVLRDVCKREIDYRLYEITADGISIYNFIRRYCRDKIMSLHGLGESIGDPVVPTNECRKTFLKSLWQLFIILITRRKAENLIRSFERIENVNGLYVDKFTDPLIDLSKIGDSYIIFEQGRSGRHLSPRIHKNKVVYTDCVYRIAQHIYQMIRKSYLRKYGDALDLLLTSVEKAFPEITIDKAWITNEIITKDFCIHCYEFLFKRLGVKRLFAPARGSFMHIIPAARKLGIKVLELQHGVTYSESLTYSGYIDSLFSPDYFLSFTKMNSAWCYGIPDNKVIKIGWAFEKYVNDQNVKNDNTLKVLVISSPEISEKMVSVTCDLASHNPNVYFYFRPHPNEQLDSKRLERLNALQNIEIDNNQENVMVTLMRFYNVLGENSTVLYEALSMGKKVGKLHMGGLEPRYLNEGDESCFYEISDNKDFVDFIKAPLNEKPSKKLYTDFRPEVVNQLLLS